MIAAIVAVDNDWGIGYNNQLLENIPEDLKRFKELTTGHTVVMGTNTWKSLPKKPLPNRRNIILSRKKEVYPHDEYLRMTKMEFGYWLEDHPKETVFIIGGARTYAEYLDICNVIYLTKIYKSHDNIDAYFPNIVEDSSWVITDVSDIKTFEDINYQFITYKRL